MKTIKRIHLGQEFSSSQMKNILGGEDLNKAAYCSCTGSNNSASSCNNNLNTQDHCYCAGNGSNKNEKNKAVI